MCHRFWLFFPLEKCICELRAIEEKTKKFLQELDEQRNYMEMSSDQGRAQGMNVRFFFFFSYYK